MANPIHQEHGAEIYAWRLREDEIRVLKLDTDNEGIAAELTSTGLRIADYVAISYVWGSTASLARIEVNGKPFRVTQNLLELLQVLASSIGHNHKIWIDAIAINQEDEDEKAAQVNNMRAIYRQATWTLVYLAPPANVTVEDQALVIQWLQRLHESMPMEEWLRSEDRWEVFWNARAYAATADMMYTPWFHRRWVVQEVAVSRDAWVQYGAAAMMSWPAFSDAMEKVSYLFNRQFNRPGFQINSSMRVFDIEPLFAICRLRSLERGYGLLDIMTALRRCNASDPRDRVFALLGLCHVQESDANKAVYNDDFSMLDVCLRFARSHILLYNNLDVLCLAQEEARIQRIPGGQWHGHIFVKQSQAGLDAAQFLPDLPTWAPNLSSFYAQWLHGHETAVWRDRMDPYFNASRGCWAEVHNINELRHSKLLEVNGIVVDTVDAIQTNTPVPHPDWKNPHGIVFENMYRFTKQQCSYRSPRERLTAFFRTISAGGRRDGTRDFLNDQGLRRYLMTFFGPSRFGRMLQQDEGLVEPEPETFADWYVDREAGERYHDNPIVLLTKLCFGVLAATEKRKLALLPSFSQKGDKICVLFGCSSPIVLQPSAEHNRRYRVRGEAYMDGWMFGEAIRAWRKGELEKTRFVLE